MARKGPESSYEEWIENRVESDADGHEHKRCYCVSYASEDGIDPKGEKQQDRAR